MKTTFYNINPHLLPQHELGGPGDEVAFANPSCKDCYGTGSPGSVILTGQRPLKGKINKLRKEGELKVAPLTCKCVVRAKNAETRDEIPWLRRADRRNAWAQEVTSGDLSGPNTDSTDEEGLTL